MSKIITYRDLEAWQVAMNFVEHCYLVTAKFPDSERYGLTSQLRLRFMSPDDKKRLLRDCDSTARLLNGLFRSIEAKFVTTRDDVDDVTA
jgi:hypothetical protein